MTELDKINIGLLGAGVVGGSVLDYYYHSRDRIAQITGIPIEISHVLIKDSQKARNVSIPDGVLTTTLDDITLNPNINVVVSLLGNEDFERYAVSRSLSQGKFVVTANKMIISKYGPELFDIAKEHGVSLMFEAAVGGGIQIIDNLINRYTPNRIQSVLGILNGTTNFILTKMAKERMAFEDALAFAQEAGLAEPDTTNDIEGYNAAYKLAILASLAFRKGWVDPSQIHCEGITQIHSRDFKNAEDMGYVIKLIATANDTQRGIEAWVAPVLLPHNHLLTNIDGQLNGILLRGDPIGDTQLAGAGAGGETTAASVWSDIFKATHHLRRNTLPEDNFFQGQANVVSFDECAHSNYVRLTIRDGLRIVQDIGRICSDNLVSINQILQLKDRKWVEDGIDLAEMAIDMDPSGEGNITQAIADIARAPYCVEIGSRFRVLS
ncbi:hypothetical protein A3C26_01305 [Candidatus Daviesbacteria bacterium RIFCSPHIGHO2_02_FULL_39_12]|uniref:Homoserine dehydrogenase n=2 Tax=Candidatus Daviesiibacteriota TaxID=1752718 RepID=A0A1F5JBX0_9BACT|nr:MAG: hypothetical protein A3C26_01305 [Candidatus Daviesbacteria bacterium RIFCSPHIGHO2_02_FULL_39_12]OGE71999.1 MAG: hypothetical protein A3H40_00455 [Candidatus Daviesbacteria bacterium RIFCSPLOWO2_02_FULL_38_15]